MERVKSIEDPNEATNAYISLYTRIKLIFDEINKTKPMELLRHNKERAKYLLNYFCRVVFTTSSFLILKHEELFDGSFQTGSLIFEEAAQVLDFETVATASLFKGYKRITMIADPHQQPPWSQHQAIQRISNLDQTLYKRLVEIGHPKTVLNEQFRCPREISSISKLFYTEMRDFEGIPTFASQQESNPVLKNPVQFISVDSEEVRGLNS